MDLAKNVEKARIKYGNLPIYIEYDGEFVNMVGNFIPLYDKNKKLKALGLTTDSEDL